MKSSRRGLSIAMVVDRGTFKNNQLTLFLCFSFIPKTLPKTVVLFTVEPLCKCALNFIADLFARHFLTKIEVSKCV